LKLLLKILEVFMGWKRGWEIGFWDIGHLKWNSRSFWVPNLFLFQGIHVDKNYFLFNNFVKE